MNESRPRLRRLSRMNHGKPVGPALSPTCTLGQAFKGRKTDEAKARGFFIKARGAKQSAPFSKAGYMTATDSLPGKLANSIAWGSGPYMTQGLEWTPKTG